MSTDALLFPQYSLVFPSLIALGYTMEGKGSKRGHWSIEEDKILMDYISIHGKGRWNRLAKATGLKRCGKSCRLRWMNYLSPNIKKGSFSEEENDLIIRLHKLLGNRWSWIAGRVPGRTDNQVKNHWNTHLSKTLKHGKIRVSKKDFSLPVPSSQESSSQAAGEEMEPNACHEDVAQNQSVSEGEGQSGLNGCTSEEEIILQQQEQQQLSSTNDQHFSNVSGDCSLSSLWVVNNEQSLDDAPRYSLVELFEGFPLDMMWNHDF